MSELTPGPGRATGILLLGVVVVLGMISGAALFYIGQRSIGFPPPMGPPPDHPMDRLARYLDLDADQQRAIEEILDEQRVRLDLVLEESREAIRAVLRPDQQERFDNMRPPGPHRRPGRRPPPGAPPPPPRRAR